MPLLEILFEFVSHEITERSARLNSQTPTAGVSSFVADIGEDAGRNEGGVLVPFPLLD